MAPPAIQSLDHLVLTVSDIDRTVAFYTRHLGMTEVRFGEGRRALAFGSQKINLHRAGREYEPHAKAPMPGSADLCFLTLEPVEDLARRLEAEWIEIEEGPVAKTGATGPLRSIYIRDPDGNLIELSNPA